MLDAAANLECAPTVCHRRDCRTKGPANFLQSPCLSLSAVSPFRQFGAYLELGGTCFQLCFVRKINLSVVAWSSIDLLVDWS
jgi:hypothetical protein